MYWALFRAWWHEQRHGHRVDDGHKVASPPNIGDYGYLWRCNDCDWAYAA